MLKFGKPIEARKFEPKKIVIEDTTRVQISDGQTWGKVIITTHNGIILLHFNYNELESPVRNYNDLIEHITSQIKSPGGIEAIIKRYVEFDIANIEKSLLYEETGNSLTLEV